MRRTKKTVRDGRSVNDLVTRAKKGDKQAWDALVERYAPLIWSICRRHRLSNADADDVGQRVWLQLVSQLDKVRDPAALPGWLTTTTERECGTIRRAMRRSQAPGRVPDAGQIPDQQAEMTEHELLAAERHAALREAFTRLPPCCQRLIAVLIEDPPVPDAQISARLGLPVGSIGPSRSRCLEKLRRDPAIAALINAEATAVAGELSGQAQLTRRSNCKVTERPTNLSEITDHFICARIVALGPPLPSIRPRTGAYSGSQLPNNREFPVPNFQSGLNS
jgi:RNA polymerase sigma factor (sigma-70 family)